MRVKNYEPIDLTGARSYFTYFDHRIIAKQTNLVDYRSKVERILKVALLTKGTIVCAASHLTNEFTYSILSDNPVLLNQEIIVPALRRGVVNLEELFQEYKVNKIEKKELLDFYINNIESYVRWDLQSNSEWFRKRFIDELRETNSVLRRNLGQINGAFITESIYKLTTAKTFERDLIDEIVRDLPNSANLKQQSKILLDFRELLYHISGARVVNCESAIPQENYLDYSLADIKNKKIILSETEIFWKVLVELVMNSLKCRLLSIEELDHLSFDKILQIRNSINAIGFREEYDKLINISLGKYDENSLLHNFEQLMKVREKLNVDFMGIINTQLSNFLKKEKKLSKKKLLGNGVSIANGVIGLFPSAATASAVFGLAKDGIESCVNLYENYSTSNQLKDVNEFIHTRATVFTKKINESGIDNKSVFIDAVKVLTNAIADSFRITNTN